MATKKKAAVKKAAAKAVSTDKTKHNGDIVMRILLTTADGEEHAVETRIVNPRGCMLPSKVNDPQYILSSLKSQLAMRFGANNVK